MKRSFVQIEGKLYEKGTKPVSEVVMIMPDIQPYTSMIDGSLISSRSRHREHLQAHGCVEIGNDLKVPSSPPPIPDCNPEGRKELIRSQVDRLTHAQFRRALNAEIEHIRWNSRHD